MSLMECCWRMRCISCWHAMTSLWSSSQQSPLGLAGSLPALGNSSTALCNLPTDKVSKSPSKSTILIALSLSLRALGNSSRALCNLLFEKVFKCPSVHNDCLSPDRVRLGSVALCNRPPQKMVSQALSESTTLIAFSLIIGSAMLILLACRTIM